MNALNRALASIAGECSELHDAIRTRRADRSENAARNVHDLWLAARAVYLRLLARTDLTPPGVACGGAELRAQYLLICKLFGCARSELANERLNRRLAELEASLSSAVAAIEPTCDGRGRE